MTARAAILPGQRLHLQHGPIDLVIGVDGAPGVRKQAFAAAQNRFETVLAELVAELELLRRPWTGAEWPEGAVARRMARAADPHRGIFVTPMAAVAGAVADEILGSIRAAAEPARAYVNNGGDIALHLAPDRSLTAMIADHRGRELGRVRIAQGDGIGGIATSGRHGRSFSLGIADSVTVLASNAAMADVAATLLANAVDLPGHPAVTRIPACALQPDSDLGSRLVVTGCGPLQPDERDDALGRGVAAAERMRARGLIRAAFLHLQGATVTTGAPAGALAGEFSHA